MLPQQSEARIQIYHAKWKSTLTKDLELSFYCRLYKQYAGLMTEDGDRDRGLGLTQGRPRGVKRAKGKTRKTREETAWSQRKTGVSCHRGSHSSELKTLKKIKLEIWDERQIGDTLTGRERSVMLLIITLPRVTLISPRLQQETCESVGGKNRSLNTMALQQAASFSCIKVDGVEWGKTDVVVVVYKQDKYLPRRQHLSFAFNPWWINPVNFTASEELIYG